EKGRPTGYPSSIRNLVPSCGKCNQSKGKTDWKTWMVGKARFCPSQRGIVGLEKRIQNLEAFEKWANCKPLPIEQLIDAGLWNDYYSLQDEILLKMKEVQRLATIMAKQVAERK